VNPRVPGYSFQLFPQNRLWRAAVGGVAGWLKG